MARNRDKLWWGILRKKLFRPSSVSAQKIMVVHTNNGRYSEEFNSSVYAEEDNACGSEFHSREDMAAVVIQSFFRGHLAKRAYRALKSLVKLQALVRGVMVRRQARLALQCMHALARLQITVRARQLLINNRFINNH